MAPILPDVIRIFSHDFNQAWERAIENCLHGPNFIFGSKKEPKKARDSSQLIILSKRAVQQVECRMLHPKATFKTINQYCEEFTSEFLQEQMEMDDDDDRKHPYTYYERLTRYEGNENITNQLQVMKRKLEQQIKTKIPSNQTQAITWIPFNDTMDDAHPVCLQRIWLRWYEGNYVDLHFDWRSRDLINAWQSNLIALVDMMNREVIKPNDCTIARVVDYNDSLHIYEADIKYAQSIVPMR